jgi:hypothetical protein
MTKRTQRTARKLVLPLIAIAMMTSMMAVEAARRTHPTSGVSTGRAPAAAAARTAHDLRQR